jgi:glyoxylase-like metal-dependent hydrolase (beta-lactamase superfamily II)
MAVERFAPGLWGWSGAHPEWTPERGGVGGWERDVNSWLLEEADEVVLIDPLVSADSDLFDWFDERVSGRTVHVLVTVYWHLRSAEALRDRYGATVWGNAKTREGVEEIVTATIEDGVPLPAGVMPFTPIPNDSDEDETAFWLPSQRALAVGDILVGTAEGPRIWWEQDSESLRTDYRIRVRPALRRLLALPIEMILLTHGPPVTADGRQALVQALEATPWQRPKA